MDSVRAPNSSRAYGLSSWGGRAIVPSGARSAGRPPTVKGPFQVRFSSAPLAG
ncbi:hypothetical protein ACFQYP_15670 [Nonomuraea antimicrobica]